MIITIIVSVSPEVLVGPLDPEHIAAAVVLVQLRLDQRPVQVLGGSELKLWQLAGGQVSVQKIGQTIYSFHYVRTDVFCNTELRTY